MFAYHVAFVVCFWMIVEDCLKSLHKLRRHSVTPCQWKHQFEKSPISKVSSRGLQLSPYVPLINRLFRLQIPPPPHIRYDKSSPYSKGLGETICGVLPVLTEDIKRKHWTSLPFYYFLGCFSFWCIILREWGKPPHRIILRCVNIFNSTYFPFSSRIDKYWKCIHITMTKISIIDKKT